MPESLVFSHVKILFLVALLFGEVFKFLIEERAYTLSSTITNELVQRQLL